MSCFDATLWQDASGKWDACSVPVSLARGMAGSDEPEKLSLYFIAKHSWEAVTDYKVN